MHFLVIDHRFQVPVFVFLELDPRRPGADSGLHVRQVSLDRAEERASSPHDVGLGARAGQAIGQDPERPSRFLEFASEGRVRAAGFALIEPRYVGPTWESYLSVFRPEGERRSKAPADRPVGRPLPRPVAIQPQRK